MQGQLDKRWLESKYYSNPKYVRRTSRWMRIRRPRCTFSFDWRRLNQRCLSAWVEGSFTVKSKQDAVTEGFDKARRYCRVPRVLVILIRDETTLDHDKILRVTIEAFADSEFGHNGEAELIDALRGNADRYLSLVACSGDNVIGHILFTPVVIRTPPNEILGMGLGPMSVAPSFQNSCIGSSLVTEGLQRLFEQGCRIVVVLGHPEYYSRFGFLRASQFGITHGFQDLPQDLFFIHFGSQDPIFDLIGGAAYYRDEFGPQHANK